MAQNMNLGKRIVPLTNVAALMQGVERLQNREFGLPGLAVFHGPPGYGKSFACGHCENALDAMHISVTSAWTKKTLLQAILRELSISPRGTIPDLEFQAKEALIIANRTLLIDEADYLMSKGLLQTVRDLHDGTANPIVLIGMEDLPQKLRKMPVVNSRVLTWIQAIPADMRDGRLLAKTYAQGVEIEDAFLQHILEIAGYTPRVTATCLAFIKEQCALSGETSMDFQKWGGRSFPTVEAPNVRMNLPSPTNTPGAA